MKSMSYEELAAVVVVVVVIIGGGGGVSGNGGKCGVGVSENGGGGGERPAGGALALGAVLHKPEVAQVRERNRIHEEENREHRI